MLAAFEVMIEAEHGFPARASRKSAYERWCHDDDDDDNDNGDEDDDDDDDNDDGDDDDDDDG